MKDGIGHKLQVGDKVELWPDQIGQVVCSFDDSQFSPAYPEAEWGYIKDGALIETSDGNLFHYTRPDEDFKKVAPATRIVHKAAR